MAVVQDITIYKNEDIELDFTNVQKPITGWTIEFTIRTKAGVTGTPIVQQMATIVSDVAGTYKFLLSGLTDTLQKAKVYGYDVQRIDLGSHAVLSIGAFEIVQEVLVP